MKNITQLLCTSTLACTAALALSATTMVGFTPFGVTDAKAAGNAAQGNLFCSYLNNGNCVGIALGGQGYCTFYMSNGTPQTANIGSNACMATINSTNTNTCSTEGACQTITFANVPPFGAGNNAGGFTNRHVTCTSGKWGPTPPAAGLCPSGSTRPGSPSPSSPAVPDMPTSPGM